MKKIILSIIVVVALSSATGCMTPNDGFQLMPWWGDAWQKPIDQPPTTPPGGSQYFRKGAMNPNGQNPMAQRPNSPNPMAQNPMIQRPPQRPSGDAINVTVGDE